MAETTQSTATPLISVEQLVGMFYQRVDEPQNVLISSLAQSLLALTESAATKAELRSAIASVESGEASTVSYTYNPENRSLTVTTGTAYRYDSGTRGLVIDTGGNENE